MCHRSLVVLLTVPLLTVGASRAEADRPVREKPNVIVVFTDDHGWADLGANGSVNDIRTPHLDRLANEGVRFTDGYVTAPQCCPSRAGLLTGRYQGRFGFDANGFGPLPLEERTIANRLKAEGYHTGMVGKWHLDPNPSDRNWIAAHTRKPDVGPRAKFNAVPAAIKQKYHPHARGFTDAFHGPMFRVSTTFDLEGNRFETPRAFNYVRSFDDRLDLQTKAAETFIDQHHDKPFFLYLAYFAPHVPLASSPKYLSRFPGEMPERRRYALAMISAIDDGMGRIVRKLKDHGIDRNTVIVFMGDNGAPLKLHRTDHPISKAGGAWDGSLNTPLNGEKGMLAEGGIRVPFFVRWPGTIPGERVERTPVISLDITATTAALAGLEVPDGFDGANLLPLLIDRAPLADRLLYWRFWSQTAVRSGRWKLLRFSDRSEFLFDLANDPGETRNLLTDHPAQATRLRRQLDRWERDQKHPTQAEPHRQELFFYHHFFSVPLPEGVEPTDSPFR